MVIMWKNSNLLLFILVVINIIEKIQAQTLQLDAGIRSGIVQAGVMFDVKAGAYSAVTLVEYDHHIRDQGGSSVEDVTVEVYAYSSGSFVSVHGNASSWTRLGSVTVTPAAAGTLTSLGSSISSLTIAAGATVGLYITLTSTATAWSVYNQGPQANGGIYVYAQSYNHLSVSTGYSKLYPFSGNTSNRAWSGAIRYQVDDLEKAALMAIYDNTNGSSWTNNWDASTQSKCDFAGITCYNGNVIQISLGSNNVVGSLPTDLGLLTNMWRINLETNVISGKIPEALVKMPSLFHLNLKGNAFTGFDQGFLDNTSALTMLTSFIVSENAFTSIPPELSSITTLKHLNFRGNNLSGEIPASLSNLTQLNSFNVLASGLSGTIPAWLSTWTQLNELVLSNNNFSGNIPVNELGRINTLQRLSLANNDVTGVVVASSSLCGLRASSLIILEIDCNEVVCDCCTNCIAPPSSSPSVNPSSKPSVKPSLSYRPSRLPSSGPTYSVKPSISPSSEPSKSPSLKPSVKPSKFPSLKPSVKPSNYPSYKPSLSKQPSIVPSGNPSTSAYPSSTPSVRPSFKPSTTPSLKPSSKPSISLMPSNTPSLSLQPSSAPSLSHVPSKSQLPSAYPSKVPSIKPSLSFRPTIKPSMSHKPSANPSRNPTSLPTSKPSSHPSVSMAPSSFPSETPSVSLQPSKDPSSKPSLQPSAPPSDWPSRSPSTIPSKIPSYLPSSPPTRKPSVNPSKLPTYSPTVTASEVPSLSKGPTDLPTLNPSSYPSSTPTTPAPTVTVYVDRNTVIDLTLSGLSSPALGNSDIIIVENSVMNSLQPSIPDKRISIKSVSLLVQNPRRLIAKHSTIRSLQGNNIIDITLLVSSESPMQLNANTFVRIAMDENLSTVLALLKQSGSPTFAALTSVALKQTAIPSVKPSYIPSKVPSTVPTTPPSSSPSNIPSNLPSSLPSEFVDETTFVPSSVPIISTTYTPSESYSPTWFAEDGTVYPSAYPTKMDSEGTNNDSKAPLASPRPTSMEMSEPLIPTLSPSTAPTQNPSVAPSRTDPVIGFYILSSTMEKAINSTTTWEENVLKYDIRLGEFFDQTIGKCTVGGTCESNRRLESDDQIVFNIIDLDSTLVNSADACILGTNTTKCQVSTLVSFIHYEPLYSYERSKFIIVRESVKFIEDNPNELVYDGPRTQFVSTTITLTIEGVEADEMNTGEIDILEESVNAFLDEILAQFNPPIDIVDVHFDSQSLQLNVIANEQRRKSRYLQQGLPDDDNMDDIIDYVPSITVNLTITGEYLPPPEIDFTMVVVETFDDEGDEFVEVVEAKSQENEVTYFSHVTKANVVAIVEQQQNPSAGGASAPFGGLGADAGISLIVVGSSLFFIIMAYHITTVLRRYKRKATNQQAIQTRALSVFGARLKEISLENSESSSFER